MEAIREDFDVFVHDGDKAFGAVRQVMGSKRELVVYVEDAGDFVIPFSAIASVHDEKVVLDRAKLDPRLRQAIGHAHKDEDPRIP